MISSELELSQETQSKNRQDCWFKGLAGPLNDHDTNSLDVKNGMQPPCSAEECCSDYLCLLEFVRHCLFKFASGNPHVALSEHWELSDGKGKPRV